MTDWLFFTVFLLMIIYQVQPQALPNVIYKLSLVTMAGVAGYWMDRSAFPYARPESYMQSTWSLGVPGIGGKACSPHLYNLFIAAQIRRALIMGAAMLAASLGL
ncbi:MAG: putative holin [Methylophilaceae bacterium]